MQSSVHANHKALSLTIVCSLLLFLSACNPPARITITPTPSVTASFTPSSTPTPAPTRTVQPSATSLPTATVMPLVTGLGQVTFNEHFDDLVFPFNIYGPARIESGVLVLEREAGYQSPPDMWPTGGIYGIAPIAPDTTTVVLFKANGSTGFNIGYHVGDYETESLRRFNFSSSGSWNLYKGKSTSPIKSWKSRQARANTWYFCSLRRSANGDMDIKLWQRDNPESIISFHGNLGPEWETLKLTFFADFRYGSFMLDEYQNLK